MATFDYARLAALADEKVERFGRDATLVKASRTPASATEPWRGPGAAASTLAVKAVFGESREIALEVIFRMIGVPVSRLDEWRRQYNRYLLAALPSTGRFRGPIYWYAARARQWIDERRTRLEQQLDQLAALLDQDDDPIV